MIINTQPTPDRNVTQLVIPSGDISLDTGMRLLIEMLNPNGIIVDKKVLEIPALPNLIVNGQEVNAIDFIKSQILEVSGLKEATS